MDRYVVQIIMIALLIFAFYAAVTFIVNLIGGVINFKKPERICAKCGKYVTKKAKRCSKCKTSFEN